MQSLRFRAAASRAALVVVLLAGFVAQSHAQGVRPAFSAQTDAVVGFDTGSLIIPMDVAYQNFGMFKAYGLVYRLLRAGIPVHWAIKGNYPDKKAFGEVDFTATTVDQRTNAVIGSHGYAGGPFIIAQANVAAATPIIEAWWAAHANQPAVHRATAPIENVNINIILTRAPLIALESANNGIAIAYFKAAGIPDSEGKPWTSLSTDIFNQTRIAAGELFQTGACSTRKYDVFVTPHNGGYSYSLTNPADPGTRTYAALDYFVFQGGGWIALCHSILSNENNIAALYKSTEPSVRSLFASSQNTGFLTQSGFTSIANGGGTWTVNEPSLPIGQAVPTPNATQGLPGGSVQTWLNTSVSYLPGVERVAWFQKGSLQYDWAINGVYHGGDGRGKLTFLGGHSYATSLPYSNNFEAPYLRFFYNALFFNGAAVANLGLVPSPLTIPQGYVTPVQIQLKNTGASVAKNVTGLVITLQSGVTYTTMISGPEPAVAFGPGGTTTLTFAPLGDVAASSTPLIVGTTMNFPTTGNHRIATLSASYGDVFSESFQTRDCQDIVVTPAPALQIDKTPELQGSIYPGQVVTWTLTYRNTGAAALQNGVVEDILPAGFAFKSSTPVASSVLPLAGGTTRVRWNVGPVAANSGPLAITISAYAPATVGNYINSTTFTGQDAGGASYSASDTAQVNLITAPYTLGKNVDNATAKAGDTLTYTINPSYNAPDLLTNVLISDAIPPHTTYLAASATAGGLFGFTSLAKEDGLDDAEPPKVVTVLAVSTTTVAEGGTVAVTMTLTNQTGGALTNVTPDPLGVTAGTASCTVSPSSVASVAAGGTAVFTFTCTMTSIGEKVFIGSATAQGTGTYDFAPGTSPSVLVTRTLNATGHVVTWRLGSNTAAIPGADFALGASPAVFTLQGDGTKKFFGYQVINNTWIDEPRPADITSAGTVKNGGALVYDGGGYINGFLYALVGNNTNQFYRYDLNANTWAQRANTPAAVNGGGALTYLNGYVYALQGGTQNFWRYDPDADTWLARASTGFSMAKGAALTTDGTFIYAFQGGSKIFLRYSPVSDTWTRLADTAANVDSGGALTRIGGFIYALRGAGQKTFWRYDIAATTWSTLAPVFQNVTWGGALTTDGTTIWATRGGDRTDFWSYDVAKNSWSVRAVVPGTVKEGGAIAWAPGSGDISRNTTATANKSLVTSGQTVTVTMTLTSATAVSGVTGSITPVLTNGATVPTCTAGTQPTVVPANTPTIFTWTCTVNSSTTPGSVVFNTSATGTTPATTWATATSNSVLVSPPLTFKVTVNNSIPTDVYEVTNVAMMSDTSILLLGADSNPAKTVILRPALSITKSVSPTGEVAPGTILTYTLTIRNDGSGPATEVDITDAVPTNTTYVAGSCTAPSGNCGLSGGGHHVHFWAFTLPANSETTRSFQVTANTGLAVGTYLINNTASLTSLEVTTPVLSNTVTNTLVVEPKLSIVKSQTSNSPQDADGRVLPGNTITYTLLAKNVGSTNATSVVVTDAIPAGTTYVANSITCTLQNPAGACSSTSTTGSPVTSISANIATLQFASGGQEALITFQVTVDSPAIDGSVVLNFATLDAFSLPAPVTSNEVSYAITAEPELIITKSATPDGSIHPDPLLHGTSVTPGSIITYTLEVTNIGTANTLDAYINDNIPANTTYVPGSTKVNGIEIDELTEGVEPPVSSNLAVFSPGYGDEDGDAGILVVGPSNKATITFQVEVAPAPLDNGTVITNQASAATATLAEVNSNLVQHPIYTTPTLLVQKSVVFVNRAPGDLGDPPVFVYPGDELIYTLTVTNSGTMVATNVVLSDAVPANSFYIAGSASDGGTFNSGVITWTGLTVAPGNPVTRTFRAYPTDQNNNDYFDVTNIANTSYTHYSTSDLASASTATPASNQVVVPVKRPITPTEVKLRTFEVTQSKDQVLITWETSFESNNLGFNVWREQGGARTKVNKSMIAGSAFVTKRAVLVSDRSYRLRDKLDSSAFVQYWLEDVDTSGVTTLHGPVSPVPSSGTLEAANVESLAELGQDGNILQSAPGVGVLRPVTLGSVTAAQTTVQRELAADAGLKIRVTRQGWHRITRASMIEAGFDPGSDPAALALYMAGIEQAIVVNDGGDRSFDLSDSIEFYGFGLDTLSTGARTYWLRANPLSGKKTSNLRVKSSSGGGAQFSSSVPFVYQRKDRNIWAAEQTQTAEDESNFFGPVVTPWSAVTQELALGEVDLSTVDNVTLSLTLLGATEVQHHAQVSLNGRLLGSVSFNRLERRTFDLPIRTSDLVRGTNTLSLLATGGDSDVSVLVDTKVTYPHLLRANGGLLEAAMPAGRAITVSGFATGAVRAYDVTEPSVPIALPVKTSSSTDGWVARFSTLPATTPRSVIVFADSRLLAPSELAPNMPSTLGATLNTMEADLLIISHAAFTGSAAPLATVRRAQGIPTTIVDVEDIYDEYNFGIRSPEAIRDYLRAKRNSSRPPRWVLLVGDASIDPRGYLGVGAFDFVPTKLVATAALKTASDAWFTDFDGDGTEDLPIGRIPVRTADQANIMIGKIARRGTPTGAWAQQALLVADKQVGYKFDLAINETAALLPSNITPTIVRMSQMTTSAARTAILTALRSGQLLVQYSGHSSVGVWGSSTVFRSSDAATLTNGEKLPVVFAMNCFNGYFHDLWTDSIAEAFLRAPSGGAVAVWASSSLTSASAQELVSKELMRQLFGANPPTLGEAVRRAKSATQDRDVRRSWILFGDPSMNFR
jgi:uncharacterized repeat protein (TIGR01451 family)